MDNLNLRLKEKLTIKFLFLRVGLPLKTEWLEKM